MNKKDERREKNKRIEEQRQAQAILKRERKAVKVIALTELEQKVKDAAAAEAKLQLDREAAMDALPPKRFYFTVVTEIPGKLWEREKAKAYALTEEEADEYLKKKFIDKMNSRPIRSCELVDWGDYNE